MKSHRCVLQDISSVIQNFPHLSQYLLNVFSPTSAGSKQKNTKKQWSAVKQTWVLKSSTLRFQSDRKWCDLDNASPSEKWCNTYHEFKD